MLGNESLAATITGAFGILGASLALFIVVNQVLVGYIDWRNRRRDLEYLYRFSPVATPRTARREFGDLVRSILMVAPRALSSL